LDVKRSVTYPGKFIILDSSWEEDGIGAISGAGTLPVWIAQEIVPGGSINYRGNGAWVCLLTDAA
jgi:hypothetical protein